jgi:4-hydroxy-tetrahydrodipicolinate reductase
MKIAVIGKGKTGSEVIRLLGKKRIFDIFDSKNVVTTEKLKGADAVIIFIPGEGVKKLLPIVKKAEIPAVWGSTGFAWPKNLDEELNEDHIQWVTSANFSLGMQVIRRALMLMGQDIPGLLPDAKLAIHETHHTEKKDKPSGTALLWEDWLKLKCKITSKREGDVKGIHALSIKTKNEIITLSHEALDRSIFAEGAIWAAEYLIGYPTLPGGLYQLADLIDMN